MDILGLCVLGLESNWVMPIVNYNLMREEMLAKTRAKVGQAIYQTLKPNSDTLYFMVFFPLVGIGPITRRK